MWFELVKQPLAWGPAAPEHFRNEAILDAPPERVFEILADPDAWPRFFREMKHVRWLSQPPGVGARREAELDIISFREEFLAWEPGRRMAFDMVAATLPLSRSIQEDYRLEPAGDGQTRLVWEIHFDVRWFLKPVAAPIRWRFGRMVRRATDGLAAYVRGSRA